MKFSIFFDFWVLLKVFFIRRKVEFYLKKLSPDISPEVAKQWSASERAVSRIRGWHALLEINNGYFKSIL